MKVVYTAPTRGHHFKYAETLNSAGCLKAFISGFPRLSPFSKITGMNGKLYRSDILQTLYIGSLKGNFPEVICNWLSVQAKIEQDYGCRKFLKDCDIFLFYNGCGLNSSRYGKKKGVINIVEVVNTHVAYQEDLLKQEHNKINANWNPFPNKDKNRRLKEYEEADYILIPSEFVKNSFLIKGFPEEKLLKVPYGFNRINHDSIHDDHHSYRKNFTVLFVGSISIRKGIRYLIEAFKKLEHPKKKLILVGSNSNDGALNGVNIPPEVIFSGVLKGKQLEDAYQSADVFCLPSIEDGFGLVMGEALSFGLPIIATSNTGANEIIVDGKEGFIVPIGDSKAISEKLQILANDPQLLNNIRLNAIAKSKYLDGWEETGKNLIDTLNKVYLKT